MQVTFKEEGHIYESFPARSWTSVTRVVETFHEKFNAPPMALRNSQDQFSKWYGIEPEEILSLWEKENRRSTDVGHRYHGRMESKATRLGSKKHRGKVLRVIPTPFINGVKTALDQKLGEGVYPEHIIYNERIGVCGQSDLVFVADGFVDVSDYKTVKELKLQSWRNKSGQPKMMLPPVAHLEDCHLYHYALQLSIYLKLILMKNPDLKPGKLTLIHVMFELDGVDQYGFPIAKVANGIEVVKEIKKYEVPYLEKEAVVCLKKIMSLNSTDRVSAF
jgi:hypothetical protein